MGDHMAVFRSLRELFPQVDPRMLKAVAIEHQKDVDSAVVAVLDEVMPSMIGSVGASCIPNEAVTSMVDSVGTSSANHDTRETGNSSSAGHDALLDEANGKVDSLQSTSSTELITEMLEKFMGVKMSASYRGLSEHLKFPAHPVPELNDNQCAWTDFSDLYLKPSSEKNLAHSGNEVNCDGYLSSEYIGQSLRGENMNGSINLNVAPVQERDSNNTTAIEDGIAQDNSMKFPLDYADFMDNSLWSMYFTGVPSSEVSFGVPSIEKDAFAPVLDFPNADMGESSVESAGVLERKDTNSAGIDYNKQQSGDRVEHDDTFLSSKTVLLPDLNSNHFASMASTHSSHSVSVESLEDSIAVAKNNKNDLVPSLELVTKMIGDVELLEEKAKMAKRESSVSGTGILTKVEELKEMLNHAKEANDMHAGEVFGEKSILTTEARELQSRLQRLSDERDSHLAVIEEIRQTLEERLVTAQQEIEAAEKEKNEKEASAQALLREQEKEMNSIVEISRNLQKEAEENSKLKDFLVERGHIVDTLQGEMAVICEDVSQLKRIVDEPLSWSKLQRSTMSSLSSSLHKSVSSSDRTLHSSLHKSGSSSDRTVEAVKSTDKHTVAEDASPVVEDPDNNERTVEMFDGCDLADKGNSEQRHSNEDGWEILVTEDEEC